MSKQFERYPLLGVGCDVLSRDELREQISQTLHAHDSQLLHIVTLNPEYLMAAQDDAGFASAVNRAQLIVSDGVGITAAMRVLHNVVTDRITGAELIAMLSVLSAESDDRIFLLGGRGDTAARAADRLATNWNASIAGTWSSGSAAPEHDQESLRQIADTGARIVLVAYGAPGQVIWIDRNSERLSELGVRVAVGVGGAFDVLAGNLAPPPKLVSRFGMEWVHRLVQEPWRWRRQLALPRFALLVMAERFNPRR